MSEIKRFFFYRRLPLPMVRFPGLLPRKPSGFRQKKVKKALSFDRAFSFLIKIILRLRSGLRNVTFRDIAYTSYRCRPGSSPSTSSGHYGAGLRPFVPAEGIEPPKDRLTDGCLTIRLRWKMNGSSACVQHECSANADEP